MNQFPRVDSDELATKTDLRQLGDQLQAEMSGLKSELRSELKSLQAETDKRFVNLEKGIAALQVDIAEQARKLTDKMANHSRNTILAVLAMTVPIWVSILVPLLSGSAT